MTKGAPRCDSRFLTIIQKGHLKESATEKVPLCEAGPGNVFDRLITMDECCVYHCNRETKK